MTHTTHETFTRAETIAPGSDRSFGLVMSGAIAVLALTNFWFDGRWWPWLGAIAVVLLIAAIIFPLVLRPLNWAWFKFGLLLHAVVNPIVMGLLFFLTVTPTGIVMRALGRDLLRLKREPKNESYWIARQPPGPTTESFKDQF